MSETIGFSGTRNTSILGSLPKIEALVSELPEGTRVVTGACQGADAMVARAAKRAGYHVHTIVPANRRVVDVDWQRYCDTFEEMPAGTDYRARNKRIVELSDRLIALPEYPETAVQSQRSGTWMTVRIARHAGKPVTVHLLKNYGAEREEEEDEGRRPPQEPAL